MVNKPGSGIVIGGQGISMCGEAVNVAVMIMISSRNVQWEISSRNKDREWYNGIAVRNKCVDVSSKGSSRPRNKE